MDFDREESSASKLHNKATYLLTQIKFKDKKRHQELINEWEDAHISEVKAVFDKIVEAYRELC